MPNTFKLKTKANVGVTTSDVYVVPAATTTVVIGVTLANTSGQSTMLVLASPEQHLMMLIS